MARKGDMPVYGYKKGEKKKLHEIPPDVIPIDDNTIGRFGNVGNFYDISDTTITNTMSITKSDGKYKVSSPFLKVASTDRINSILETYAITDYEKIIKQTESDLSAIPKSVEYYNNLNPRSSYGKIIDKYLDVQKRIVKPKEGTEIPIESYRTQLAQLQSKKEMYLNGLNGVNNQDTFNVADPNVVTSQRVHFEESISAIDEEIRTTMNTISEKTAKKEKAKEVIEAFKVGKIKKGMIPGITSFIETTLKGDLAIAEERQKSLSHVVGAVEHIVGDVRGELEFKSFATEQDFNIALMSLDTDKETRAVVSAFYGPQRGEDGYISISKKPYLSNQTVVINKDALPSKRFVMGGIDDIPGFDVTNDNVEKYLQPIGSDAVYEAANRGSGAISYKEVKQIQSMLNGYMQPETEAIEKETAHIHQKIKQEAEYTSPSSKEVDYEANKARRKALKTPSDKIHNDEVIDSIDNLDERVKNKLKIRNVVGKEKVSTVSDIAQTDGAKLYAPLDLEMLDDIYRNRKGVDSGVRGKLGTFLKSVNDVTNYEKAISEGNYYQLSTISNSPMYDMPYGTDDQIKELTETARQYAKEKSANSAKSLNGALYGADDSRYWNEIEAIGEQYDLNNHDYIIQNGYLDAGSHENTSNGTEELRLRMKHESMNTEKEIEQYLTTARTIQNSDIEGIEYARQRDAEVVNSAYTKGTQVYNMRSIKKDVYGATGIRYKDLEQGYVSTDNGKKVSLQAYDEYNELMSLKDIRGNVEFEGKNMMFTPEEWLNKKVQIGENSYSIRNFSEYYDQDIRLGMSDVTMSIPNYPGVRGRQNVEQGLIASVRDFVSNAKQSVEYTSTKTKEVEGTISHTEKRIVVNAKKAEEYRRHRIMQDSPNYPNMIKLGFLNKIDERDVYRKEAIQHNPIPTTTKVKYKVPTYVHVPLFTDEKIPSPSKRTIKGLKAIQPIDVENINLQNYKEIFNAYGVDPNKTDIGKIVNSYRDYIKNDAELTEEDYSALDKIVDNRRYRLEAEKKGIKRRRVLDRPVDDHVQNTIDTAIETNRKVQLDNDILHYSVIDQTPTHATLEADYMLFDDMTVDVQYNGKMTISELLQSLNELEGANSISNSERRERQKKMFDNVTIDNTDDIILSSNGKSKTAIKRSDIYNHIMSQTEDFDIKYLNNKGKEENLKLKMNKTAHEIMSRNWSWMIQKEESVGIGFVSVYDAINNLNETDMLEAADRVNQKRLEKGTELIDITNNSIENRKNIMTVVSDAVYQKSKSGIIISAMEDTPNNVDPSIRVALKSLDSKGINYSVDTVKDELMLLRDALNSKEHSFLYKNVDDIIHNDQFIEEQISENAKGNVSLESIGEIESELSEYIDTYTDKVRMAQDADFDVDEQMKLYNNFVASVSERLEPKRNKVSNIKLFNSLVQEEIDKEIIASTKGLEPKVVEEILIGNYLAHDFPKKHTNVSKLPKKYVKEMSKYKGNWRSFSKNYQTEWVNAKNKLTPKISKVNFRDQKEAQAVIGNVYDEIISGIEDETVKELLTSNKTINITKILEASKTTTEKGKVAYQLSRSYTGINATILDTIRPAIRGSNVSSSGKSVLNNTDKVTKALVGVYRRNENISDVVEVLTHLGGSSAEGLQVLYGDDPNNILKGLSVHGRESTYHKGLAINSEEGLAALKMLEKLTGGELSIVGRGKTNTGDYATVYFDGADSKVGLTSGLATSASGKTYKTVKRHDQARRKIAKNVIDKYGVRLAKEAPSVNHISKDISSVGLLPSSLIDYDFISGKTGGYGIADPTTSVSNLKDALSVDGKKVTIFDFETSGLLGKIDDDLFAPIEFSYIEAYTKDGKIIGGDAKSIFASAPEKVKDAINGGGSEYGVDEGYTQQVNKIMNELESNGNTYNLFKNYAKYDSASGDFYMQDFKVDKVMNQGGTMQDVVTVGKRAMSKLDYVEGLVDSARNVVDYLDDPLGKENTTKINGPVYSRHGLVTNARDTLFDSDYIMGHNTNPADIKWLDHWSRLEDIGDSSELALKNIDTFETYKLALPGKGSYKLENFIGLNMSGSAHLADVDVKGTLLLANSLVENETLGLIFNEIENPIKEGDYFVKTQLGNQGVEGLGKGVYQFNGVKKVKRTKLGNSKKELTSHTQQMLILTNMLSGEDMTIPFDNVASLRRDAAQNWAPFRTLEDAKVFHSKRVDLDTNRTVNRAYNYKAWNNYTAKGNGLQEDTVRVLQGLRQRLNNGLLDQETMRVAEGVYRSGDIDDLGLLALGNIEKLDGKGYFDELARTKNFNPDRMEEYMKFAEYADSKEGQLVKEFLYEGDLRSRVHKRSGKSSDVKNYERRLYDTVKEVRSNVSMLTNEIPNQKILANVTQETLDQLGGAKYNLTGIEPFTIDVNTTNRSTIKNSMWNNVDDISERIIASGAVKKRAEAKNIAINEFIMPILSKSLDGTEVMDDALKENIKALRNNSLIGETGVVADVDESISRTLDVMIERLAISSKHNSDFINNLETIKEVDMHTVIPETHSAHTAIINTMKEKFSVALAELDEELATISYTNSNGEVVEAIDQNAKYVQNELVKILKRNDKRYKQVIQDEFGIENADAVLSHINLDMKNSAGRMAHKNISELQEVHYNAKSPELSFKTAKEIIEDTKQLYTDIDMPTTKGLTNMLTELSQNKNRLDEFAAAEPEFFEYLRKAFNGFYTKPSTIKDMNKKVENATEEYVKRYNNKGLAELQAKKTKYLQELSDRAALTDLRYGNIVGEIPDYVYDSNQTKYRAMEELGLVQTYDNKKYTGKIGMPGSFVPGVELDPSQVIITSSPSFKTSDGKTMAPGALSGYSMDELSYSDLKLLRESEYTNKNLKPVVSGYISTLDNAFEGDKRDELLKSYNKNARLKYEAKRKQMGDEQFIINTSQFSSQEKPSRVKALNESIKNNITDASEETAKQGEQSAKKAAQEVIEDIEPSVQDNKYYRQFIDGVDDTQNKTASTIKEILGSKTVRYSAVAVSAALALALTHQYTSDGGTREEKEQSAPVDDNYQKEYNGVDRNKIRIPKTTRVEENGKGLTIKASARNGNYVTESAIDEAVSNTLNSSINASVNIRYQDDRQSINQEYVQGLFSNALK